jgi:hypothetical protein
MRETLPVPGRIAAAWGSWRPDLELGEGAREEDAMTDGAGRGPCTGCVQAPHLWTMAMRQNFKQIEWIIDDEQASGWARVDGARPRSASLGGSRGRWWEQKRILSGALGQPTCYPKDHASLALLLSLLDCQRMAWPERRRSEKWAFRGSALQRRASRLQILDDGNLG